MNRFPTVVTAWIVLTTAACGGDPTGLARPTGPDDATGSSPATAIGYVVDQTVASVRMRPDSLLMIVGDRTTITAQVLNGAGQLLDRAVTWSVQNASLVTILTRGRASFTFKAKLKGKTTVRGTVSGKSGSTKLVIRGAAGAKVVLTPASATVAARGTVQFAVAGRTGAGEPATVSATWTATGGTVSGTGVYTAGSVAGTYRVIAKAPFGAADSAVITVTAAAPTSLVLRPDVATIEAGGTQQFVAFGRTSAGDSVGIQPAFTTDAGTISAEGRLTAQRIPGSGRVIATSPGGLADTAAVTITPSPITQMVVSPATVTIPARSTQQFLAYGRNALGDSVETPVNWTATAGDIDGNGVFTASAVSGTSEVKATAEGTGVSAIAQVTTQSRAGTPGAGIPFGLWAMPGRSVVAPYTSGMQPAHPDTILMDLAAAKARGARMFVNFAGGSTSHITDASGHFDYDRWKLRIDRFLPIRNELNAHAVEGTLVAFMMIDEPGAAPQWGGQAVPLATLDQMAQYSKSIFPDLLTAVRAAPTSLDGHPWRYLDVAWAQYAARKGPIDLYLPPEVAAAQAQGLGLVVGLNISKGGDGSSGLGTPDEWSMSGAEILQYGPALLNAPYACSFLSWDARASVIGQPDVAAAMGELSSIARSHVGTSCRQ